MELVAHMGLTGIRAIVIEPHGDDRSRRPADSQTVAEGPGISPLGHRRHRALRVKEASRIGDARTGSARIRVALG
jgi:hypothetical protein